MKPRAAAWIGLLAVLFCLACKGKGSGGTTTVVQAFCADTCPRDCKVDNDCDVTRGELCCSYPGAGSICQPAASCPRFRLMGLPSGHLEHGSWAASLTNHIHG